MSVTDEYLAEFAEPDGYLNFASIGPVSRRVTERLAAATEILHRPDGPVIAPLIAKYEEGKAAVARFLDTSAEQVTVVPSTSAGLFQVAFGLEGGNVVVPSHEFPANVYPWLRAAERGGPEVRFVDVPDVRVTADALAPAIDGDTVAVAVSFVDFRTGFRVDVGALRERCGEALLVVDAIQGLGAVAFPSGIADVVVAGGQKWLRAGWAAGVMAVSERALDRLNPTLTGWTGVKDFLATEIPPPHPIRPDAERFQEGSPVLFGAVAAGAAVDVIGIAGIGAIESAVLERVAELESVLEHRGAELLRPWRRPEERAGILSFRLPGLDADEVAARLESAGVIVAARAGWLRVSPHASTRPEAVAMLAEALP